MSFFHAQSVSLNIVFFLEWSVLTLAGDWPAIWHGPNVTSGLHTATEGHSRHWCTQSLANILKSSKNTIMNTLQFDILYHNVLHVSIQMLSDKNTEEEVKQALEEVCDILPKSVRKRSLTSSSNRKKEACDIILKS